MQAWVFYRQPEDLYRAGRTVRSLKAAGIPVVDDIGLPTGKLPGLPEPSGGLLILRGGAWLVSRSHGASRRRAPPGWAFVW